MTSVGSLDFHRQSVLRIHKYLSQNIKIEYICLDEELKYLFKDYLTMQSYDFWHFTFQFDKNGLLKNCS